MVVRAYYYFFLMKTRPSLKTYPLFARTNCIHKQVSEQRKYYLPKMGDTGCLQHLLYGRKDKMRILESSFSYILHHRMIVQLASLNNKVGLRNEHPHIGIHISPCLWGITFQMETPSWGRGQRQNWV